MTAASMDAVPEPVRKTARDPSGAPASSFIIASFSSITFENSGVRKYGTCSAPMARTPADAWTGPTEKFSMTC